jgi:hypothetical protein
VRNRPDEDQRKRLSREGFMSTSVTGALASALLSAELMNLDEDRCVAALGIAPS